MSDAAPGPEPDTYGMCVVIVSTFDAMSIGDEELLDVVLISNPEPDTYGMHTASKCMPPLQLRLCRTCCSSQHTSA